MMFLHFGNTFVAPEYQYSWSGNDWEGAFQICVPIFLFLSGYGLMISFMSKTEDMWMLFKKQCKRSLKLLRHYWIVTLPFVVVALWIGKFACSWDSFVLTATALRCDWCPNAWFVSLYIELILMFPLFAVGIKKGNVISIGLVFVIVVVITKIVGKIAWVDASSTLLSKQIKMLMNNLPIFLEGMLFAKYSLFDILHRRVCPLINAHSIFGGAVSVILVALAIACRAKFPLVSITELVHVPVCLLGLLILESVTKHLFQGILFVGKYSTTLWFIHGYFCWTFCQPLIYSIRFWPLAFIVFVIMSLVASFIIDKLRLAFYDRH